MGKGKYMIPDLMIERAVDRSGRIKVDTIALGQTLIVGGKGVSRQLEVVAMRKGQLFLRSDGGYYRDGQERVLIEDIATVMEEGRVGRLRILGYRVPKSSIAAIEASRQSRLMRELERGVQEGDIRDPALTPARQVGVGKLRKGLDYLLRISGPEKVIVERVTVDGTNGDALMLKTGKEDEKYLVVDPETSKENPVVRTLQATQGTLELPKKLVTANPAERRHPGGVTFWRDNLVRV